MDNVLQLLIEIGRQIVGLISATEAELRTQLTEIGATPLIQSILLIGFVGVLIIGSSSFFRGIARAAVIISLVLVAFHLSIDAVRDQVGL